MESGGRAGRGWLWTALLLWGVALLACARAQPGRTDYLDAHASLTAEGLVHVVVEIPAGTNDKWELDKRSGALHWEQKDGEPRVVQYLAYPGNYGLIPRTRLPRELGGDGDPLDVLLLGPRLERGAVVPARAIGVLRLLDGGERDDKIVAVPTSGPLSDARDVDDLESRYPGARLIVETWFTHYKGAGRMRAEGWGNADTAMEVVREASRYYEQERAD